MVRDYCQLVVRGFSAEEWWGRAFSWGVVFCLGMVLVLGALLAAGY